MSPGVQHDQIVHAAERTGGRRSAVACEFFSTVAADRGDDAMRVDFAHPMFREIGDEQGAVLVDRHAERLAHRGADRRPAVGAFAAARDQHEPLGGAERSGGRRGDDGSKCGPEAGQGERLRVRSLCGIVLAFESWN